MTVRFTKSGGSRVVLTCFTLENGAIRVRICAIPLSEGTRL